MDDPMPPQYPAAPEAETDANGLTEAEREALYATFRPGRHVEWSEVDPEFADLTAAVERIVAERVRVIEGERDAALDLAHTYRVAGDEYLARAESAEAAHERMRAAIEALDRSGRMSFDHSDLRTLLRLGGGEAR